MKRNTVRMYQRLTHVVDFITRNVGKFPKAAGVASLLKALESVVATLSEQAGILVVPSSVFEFGDRHIRIGLGRETFPDVLRCFGQSVADL